MADATSSTTGTDVLRIVHYAQHAVVLQGQVVNDDVIG